MGSSLGVLYWIFVALLIAFGILGAASIGIPFLVLGVLLICLAPFRGRASVFWPPIIGLLGLVAGYVLTAPSMCTSTGSVTVDGRSRSFETTCRSVIGIATSDASPSYVPALLIGVATGVAAGVLAWVVISRRALRRG